MKIARSLISSRATINLIVVGVVLIILGIIVSRNYTQPSVSTPVYEPTKVKIINDQVIELFWNGDPENGYVISDFLKIKPGDRIVIYWVKGCLQPRPLKECNPPWGFLDPLPENRNLFRYSRGQFAVHIIQGMNLETSQPGYFWNGNPKHLVWPSGMKDITFLVQTLPIRLYFNTIISPGIYYGAGGIRIPVEGYTIPSGKMVFWISNHR